jgi:hypothetical protein
MKMRKTANRNWNVRSLERHVAVNLCFLAMKAVSDQSGDERTHFRPAKTRTHKTPGSSHTWVVDVVQGQNGGGPEAGGQEWPENTRGNIA